MKKENSAAAGHGAPTGRITRARAAAFRANGGMIPSSSAVAKPEKKPTQQGKSKRAASDENSQPALTAGFQHKKRAVLKDVSNICSDNSYRHYKPAAKAQSKASQQVKLGCSKAKQCSDQKNSKLAPAASIGTAIIHDAVQNKVDEEMLEAKVDERLLALQNMECVRDMESTCNTAFFKERSFRGAEVINHSKNGGFTGKNIVDIDADHGNPQMCSIYAEDIYTNLRAAELIRRPSPNFMETLQYDITQGMRGILIDWLVEVSEEYRLVPDTLYLTVYVIDRFLSHNHIERQRLQLLGVTCMLIASKYEEICAPRVEEFCFITDNTYTKAEVLIMESQVLNYLGFQLSVPTIKTFLRRFLRAAQACYKVPALALGYLANYLAELTLIDYSFLKFLPSVIAASAVLLARWTLDQSDQPWNLTLEHYTSYKASDLKATVLALQELQMNSKNCPLNAIREKYRQQKFECVAALTSPTLLQSIFC
ncbi:cyclin-A2-1-like [Phoenix dactylifera]|uniref:Cyclin-A2-1-like n=1 Tax=Phoenix dactylifera TaxID=42345 RepID=A0A8B9ANH9_PHODC|nr:cyclin-A2-1-like [Phoenix dactylifera]XP_008804859.2 cyclin-A2-1-like [Phoenix dactylifera]XP_038984869.1 cyclin-A2-1-like [Phoenix dactylifera]XP_038984871.1 cyclin-A2-1-like [Phoenix dactylifera]